MTTKRKTKQFKIGEYAMGGIIRVDITKEEPDRSLIEVKAIGWDSRQTLMADWAETDHVKWYNQILNTLNEMTTSYYADNIMNYIKEQVNKLEKTI
jgi:hypothetical protein